MKDAKGHGSNSHGGQQAAAQWRAQGGQHAVADWRATHPLPAHQSLVDKLGRYGRIGAAIYGAQALAGAAAGVGWALVHTGVI